MACNSVTDVVVRESGRYMSDEIYSRNFGVTPWITITQRGQYPNGMGTEPLNVLTYERSTPYVAEPTWSAITIEDNQEGGACLPAADVIPIASTTRTFQIYRRHLQGPDFCAEELRNPFAIMQQLNAITDILNDYIKVEWEIRDRHEYFKYTKHKVVLNDCDGTVDSTMATAYPSSGGCPAVTIDQGILDKWRIRSTQRCAHLDVHQFKRNV
jgi:hypothetical protein